MNTETVSQSLDTGSNKASTSEHRTKIRKLVILGDNKSTLSQTLQTSYSLTTEIEGLSSLRSAHVDPSQLLYIDAISCSAPDITLNHMVVTALRQGTPIILNSPNSKTLTDLTGFGLDNIEAALVVKGNGHLFYVKTYSKVQSSEITIGKEACLSSDNQLESDIDRDTLPDYEPSLTSLVELNPNEQIIQDLEDIALIESQLTGLKESGWQQDSIPENRQWSLYWDMEWRSHVLTDPSDETKNTQTARFKFTTTFNLLAANSPVKKKVFSTIVGGVGFEPLTSGQKMIRNDTSHRGWAQSMTYIEFKPTDDNFGTMENYVPINTANQVTVTAGFSWDIGFTAGGDASGPSGDVSFSYSQNESHSISTTDFKTKAESIGNNGMRFYHNAHIVGGDTTVDPVYFGFTDEGWTDQMDKMFYYHFPDGDRVRSWPSLSRELLKPDSQCVWYANSNKTDLAKLEIHGCQGLNYFYKKKGWRYCSHLALDKRDTVTIDFNKVTYDDPQMRKN